MPKALIVNNAVSTLSAAITTVGQLTLTVTSATTFPIPTGSDYFYATLLDAANIPEVVKVTGIASNVFTIVRAQDGTAARTFLSGASVRLCLCAAVMLEFARLESPAFITLPTAPTAAVGTNTTLLATTAFTVAEIVSRSAAFAQLAGGTYTGAHNYTAASVSFVTQSPGTSNTTPATTGFVAAASLAAAGIPTQTGNAGKVLGTDGLTASWSGVPGNDLYLATNYGGF